MNPSSENSNPQEIDLEAQGEDNFSSSEQAERGTVDSQAIQRLDVVAEAAPSARSSSFLTVGIGASAGGLEAFQTFFRHMDENSGMAFVLISHLAPDHDSLLSELLAKETQMPVLQVQEETRLQPDRVYVIPPNATLTVEDGILRLSTPVQARGHRAPINIFFRSLAEDQGENAVCVILSGTGSDGTIGLKSIKEFNGLAIAQDSETAKYDSMPRNAVMTGLVDYVLPVEEIPAKLIEYARHRDGLQANLGEDGMLPQAADYLSQICSLLRRRLGHDFSNYKQGTLVRRIQRRIQITQNASVAAYVQYLKAESEEVNLLFKDLLIGVTHFFRDPESFDALQHKVIAPLVENSNSEKSIRIWVAGCSSGEEAYSIAMLLAEEMERQNMRSQVQIFATDIDEQALERARHARYPESIAEQMTPERLERFFIKQNGIYQVVKHLREMCIFSQQSLISDPPFSRLDLISCRNLLIYFDSDLQKRLIPLFHYALRTDGFLFLGSSENLFEYDALFGNVSKPHRLFQRKQPMIAPQVDFPLVDRSLYRQLSQPNAKPVVGQQSQITRSIERVLLQDYAPACVIVNEQNEIIYYFGRTGKYLEPPQGLPNNNLFDLVKLGLRLDLRAAIQAARASRKIAIRERVSIAVDGQVMTTDLIVRPVKDANQDSGSGLLMVIFQDAGKLARFEQPRGDSTDLQDETNVVEQLEDELRVTKEQLRGTIEEIETSNEELKSANEELLSMNEEMQSSNEELQTSKEEMQSINEELETVNAELRNKVEELDAANSDVQNLFDSTQIATIFLDSTLRIKRFTPDATRLFHLIETDVGRPITDISLSLEAGVSIAADVPEVLRTLIPIEREVQSIEQSTAYKLRILPYRTLDNVIDGVVLTFVDVTTLRQARDRAQRWAQRQSAIAELGTYALQENDAAAICDRATQIICQTLNSDICSFFAVQGGASDTLLLQSGCGWPDESVGNVTIISNSHPGYTLAVQHPVTVANFAQESRFRQSALLQNLNMVSGISAIVYGTDEAYGVLTSHATKANQFTQEDVSLLQSVANALGAALEREKTTQALAKSRQRLDLALDAGNMGVWDLDVATGLTTWNHIEYEMLGLSPDENQLSNVDLFYQYVHPEDVWRVQQQVMQAIAHKTDFNSEFRINRADGQLRWLAGQGRVIADTEGNAIKVIGVNYDITDRKQNEEALQAADRRKDDFLAALGHELRNPLNALSGSLALMQSDEGSDRTASLYSIARRQLDQLTHLIDDLLDVSRISYGKIQLNCQPTDLVQILHGLVEDYQASAAQKEIALSLSVPNQPIWVQGDAVRLMQAFSNILQNAIKFSNSGDRIEVRATLQDGQVTIEIADSGIGMETEALSRIFTPFSQENRSLARSGGLGLGLPLVKGIIELHNGEVWAQSSGLNQGTEVIIRLCCLEEVESNTSEIDAALSIPVEHGDVSFQLSRILIVEDDEDSALMLQFFLEDLGYQVAIAHDGENGLAIARQFKPDLILSDIGLTAAMDGYTLAQIIRKDSSLSNTYLIAASGYGQPEDKAKAKAAGFDEHLTKPINLARLEGLIARRLSQLGDRE
ncbi:PAS domain-containing protein [Microcoleus sp. LEGE 07076]|uniref:chemotaxis protein CheB n=1 Tax=Microcoleus sp. LEGE 07076 TaxID=915322 RepID=UPI0018804B7E|nr:chemotaxis protein CheB [Microcoleus sp. LEGE 07076]MBE9184788.1 PAS domain-containing protein [Microcoleus sp. LEGE 07076]